MDFIKNLASTLGVEENMAQAVAGMALKKVQGAVADEDEGAANELADAVPEMGQWQQAAETQMAGGGGDEGGGLLGGLLGGGGGDLLTGLAGAVGGKDAAETAAIVALLGKLNIDASKATMVAPMILGFLKERLSPETLSTITKAAPFLGMLGGGGGDEGGEKKEDDGFGLDDVAGALGGLFGK